MGDPALDYRCGESKAEEGSVVLNSLLYGWRGGTETGPQFGLRMDISKAEASWDVCLVQRSNRNGVTTPSQVRYVEGRLRAKTNPFAFPVEQKCPKNMEKGNPWSAHRATRSSRTLSAGQGGGRAPISSPASHTLGMTTRSPGQSQ